VLVQCIRMAFRGIRLGYWGHRIWIKDSRLAIYAKAQASALTSGIAYRDFSASPLGHIFADVR
jgi:hypothetical protein